MKNTDMTTQDIVRILSRRKTYIIAVTLACAIIAAGISFILPRAYQSTIIIEIGQIFPPTEPHLNSKPEPLPLEDASALAQAIKSGAFIGEALQQMGHSHLRNLKVRAEAFVYGRYEAVLPVIKISAQSADPGQTVELLENLGEIIVERSGNDFVANRQSLEETISNKEQFIRNITKSLAAQEQMRDMYQKYQADLGLEKYSRGLSAIGSDAEQASTQELLFLQTLAINTQNLFLNFNQIILDLNRSIGDNQKSIIQYLDNISILRLRASLSTPTRIVKKPSLPGKPIKPRKPLIVITASFIGLVLSASAVLIRHLASGQINSSSEVTKESIK